MAKKPVAAAGEDAAAPAAEKQAVIVELRRDSKVGDHCGLKGEMLGVVTLEPGVTLNYLVDALRDGIAGEQHPVEQPVE